MPITILDDLSKEVALTSGPIPLKDLDPTGETYVEFRRPARREAENLAELESRTHLEWDEYAGGQRRTFRQKDVVPIPHLQSRMVALCLIGTNLKWRNSDKQPVFVPGKNCRTATDTDPMAHIQEFNDTWGGLPDNVATSIYRALAKWHPKFDIVGYSLEDDEDEPVEGEKDRGEE